MPIYVNVDGAQKVLSDVYANIDGAQRRVTTMYANIDGAQKNLMGYKWAKYNMAYEQVTTPTNSVSLKQDDGKCVNFASMPGSKFSFDTSTGYFLGDAEAQVSGTFNAIGASTSQNYLFLGGGNYKDGTIWGALKNGVTPKGIMGYYIPKNSTVVLSKNSLGMTNGATFSRTDNTIIIYSSQKSTTQHGDFIEYVTSNDETAYPDNGLQDGYWYIRQ